MEYKKEISLVSVRLALGFIEEMGTAVEINNSHIYQDADIFQGCGVLLNLLFNNLFIL